MEENWFQSASNWLSASVSGLEVIKKLTIVDRSIQYHNINSIIQYHSSDSMSDQTQQCGAVMFFLTWLETVVSSRK